MVFGPEVIVTGADKEAERFTAEVAMFQRKQEIPIRMKMMKALSAFTRWIQRIIEVRMPMDAFNGLRTR